MENIYAYNIYSFMVAGKSLVFPLCTVLKDIHPHHHWFLFLIIIIFWWNDTTLPAETSAFCLCQTCVCVSIMWLPQSPGDGSSPQTLHPSHVSDGITALGTHWLTAGEKGRERSLKQRLHSTHTHTEDLWCIFYTHTPLNTHAYAIYACVCVCVT